MKIVGVLLLGAAVTLFEAWPFMLLVGALHSFVPQVPALGFSASVVAVALLSLVGTLLSRPRG